MITQIDHQGRAIFAKGRALSNFFLYKASETKEEPCIILGIEDQRLNIESGLIPQSILEEDFPNQIWGSFDSVVKVEKEYKSGLHNLWSQKEYEKIFEPTREVNSKMKTVHSQQIVHSDLKPGNILVIDEGAPKIVDFGLSQAIDARPSPIPDDLNTLNPGYLAAFTPTYASREIIKGYQPDFSDDVFALGCIAYELFSGVYPYQKVPADQAEIQGLKAKRIPNITRHQWTAIRKAIAFRREKRTPTATVFTRIYRLVDYKGLMRLSG